MSENNSNRIKSVLEFCGVAVIPIVTLFFSLWPNIYEALTEPDETYAYSTKYERNPILEWNRTMTRFVRQMEANNENIPDEAARPLLRKIGKEIVQSLPAILADTGVRPADSYTVNIVNMSSRYDLKNIRVSFTGCKGVDSIRTYPDTIGSIKTAEGGFTGSDLSISTSYSQVSRAVNGSKSMAAVIVYAEDASKCQAIVEAQTSKGEAAIGKSVQDASEYNIEQYWEKAGRVKTLETLWRFVLSVGVIGIFFYIRTIKRRLPNS